MNIEDAKKTYLYIALQAELDDEQFLSYIYYMTTRWPDTEKQKCSDGYAIEWAERFKNNIEWQASDLCGKSILRSWDKKKYGERSL